MRSATDLPEPTFRWLKSTAAFRGTTEKTLIAAAPQRDLDDQLPVQADEPFPRTLSRQ